MSAGTLFSVDIPGGASHFAARPAEVWVPRDADDTNRVPVMMLLHGTSGGPTDWIDKGHILSVIDAFPADHDGQAPLLVMPDVNGAKYADTECIRTTSGADVESYIEDEVPRYVSAHYPVLGAPTHWAVGGLSEGGTCAIMIALRDQTQFGAFVDLSGLSRPTVTDSDNPARTIKELFAGSVTQYEEHDPIWLMTHHSYPDLTGWLECGSHDTTVLASQRALVTAAHGADLPVVATTIPGSHSWTVWTSGITSALAWLWNRIKA